MTFSIEDYQVLNTIGEGSFATVHLAIHIPTKKRVAIKIVPRNNFQDPDHMKRFEREVNLIKTIDHPFVAEFFELREDYQYFYIIMEYAANGNMLDYVNNSGELSEPVARRYFIQLISVLEYLHIEKHIAHRDLKAENVLLDRNNNIRLIDFGLSILYSNEDPNLKTACGSPAYASPEMIKGQTYTSSSDLWSAGILLYAMVQGELPYDDENIQKLLHKIIYTEPEYPVPISVQLRDLLDKLLQKDPNSRITLQKIKEHPWFSQTDYANLISSDYRISRKLIVAPDHDRPIDFEILTKMGNLGYDFQALASSLLQNENNRTTAVYRMLRKDKITDLLDHGTLTSPRIPASHTASQTIGDNTSRSFLPVLSEKMRKTTGQPSTDAEKPLTSHKMLPIALQVSITQTRRPSGVSPGLCQTRMAVKPGSKVSNHLLKVQTFRRKSANIEKPNLNNL